MHVVEFDVSAQVMSFDSVWRIFNFGGSIQRATRARRTRPRGLHIADGMANSRQRAEDRPEIGKRNKQTARGDSPLNDAIPADEEDQGCPRRRYDIDHRGEERLL